MLSTQVKEKIVLAKLENNKPKIWYCKIGWATDLPDGADFPMRQAIKKAFYDLTGEFPDFLFSGWGAELTESEEHCLTEE